MGRDPDSVEADKWPERLVGDVLLDAADHLKAVFSRACSSEGLSMPEGRTLRFLALGARQSDLPDLLLCGPSRVTAILNELEDRRLITRTESRGDRRQKRIQVTAEGAATLDSIHGLLAGTSPIVLALDDDERQHLRHLLLRLTHPTSNEREQL